MYKREFENLLNSGQIPKSILLFGESNFFIDEYAQKSLAKMPQNSSILKLYYHEYDYKTALSHLQNASLFDDANILIVQLDKKMPKNEAEALIESAAKNESSFFILKYHAPDAKEKAKLFTKKKSADFVRFFSPDIHEAVAVLKEHAQKLHIKISEHALRHILAINTNNIEMSLNELNKLSVYQDELDIKTIDRLIHGSADFDLNDFFDNLLNKKNIKNELKLLIDKGEDEIKILNSFQGYVVQLMMFTMSAKINGKIDSKDVLGYKLPPQLEQARASLAIKLNARIYHNLLNALQECEYLIKTLHGSDKKSLFFSTLIKIQSKIL